MFVSEGSEGVKTATLSVKLNHRWSLAVTVQVCWQGGLWFRRVRARLRGPVGGPDSEGHINLSTGVWVSRGLPPRDSEMRPSEPAVARRRGAPTGAARRALRALFWCRRVPSGAVLHRLDEAVRLPVSDTGRAAELECQMTALHLPPHMLCGGEF